MLIIKSDSDRFERYYNDGFIKICKLLTYHDFYRPGLNGFQRRLEIIQNIVRLKKCGFFKEYSTIIVFDQFELAFLLALFSGFRGKRIFWLWNILNKKQRIKLPVIKLFYDIYTFDEADAEKFNLHKNTQMYPTPKFPQKVQDDYDYSLYFVGRDKGRKKIINLVRDVCASYSIPYSISIIGERDEKGNIIQYVDYLDAIEVMLHSKAILDVNQEGQAGITIRALEAAFYNKKLITNNTNIIQAKFYNPESVFILYEDNVPDIVSFLRRDNSVYDHESVNYYSLEEWLSRFDLPKYI